MISILRCMSLACRVSHVGVSLSTHNLEAKKFEQAKLNSEREDSSDVSLTSRLSRRRSPDTASDRSQTYYGIPSMLGTPVLQQYESQAPSPFSLAVFVLISIPRSPLRRPGQKAQAVPP